MNSSKLPKIDWDSLLKQLTLVAIRRFKKEGLIGGKDAVLKGLGDSPEDFVKQAVIDFFGSFHKYKVETEGECFALIVTIMKRNMDDKISKAHAYKKTVDADEDELSKQRAELPASDDGFKRNRADELAQSFHKYAGGHQELKDVIDAAALLAFEREGPVKRADIADLLNISPEEVTKRNGRLQYSFLNRDSK